MAETAAYDTHNGFGDRETVGDSFNYSGFEHAAMGAFTGGAGLPATAPGSVADFQAFVSALEAKTTEISNTASHFTVSGAAGSYVLLGGHAGDVLLGDPSDSGGGTFWGRDGNDSIVGGAGDDTIAPGSGADTIDGHGGADTVSYFDAANSVTVSLAIQGSGQVTGVGIQILTSFENLTGSGFADGLTGDAHANVIDGGAGADTLSGGGGDDTLVSEGAGDKLIGGGGHDIFAFIAFTTSHLATVSALGTGDVVDLSGAGASLGLADFTAVSHFDHHAGEVRAEYHANTDRTVFLFDVDGDRKADFTLVVRGADASDFSHFAGVDASGLSPDVIHDHGALTV